MFVHGSCRYCNTGRDKKRGVYIWDRYTMVIVFINSSRSLVISSSLTHFSFYLVDRYRHY